MFQLGQITAAVLVPKTNWDPAPRLVEAATALAIACMAVEILALPRAGKRWLIAGALGVFHGLYFALFLRTTDFHPTFVLTGAAIAELLLIGIFAFVFSRVARVTASLRPLQVSAGLMLVVGTIWLLPPLERL